jgi:cytochrome P450
MHFFQPSLLQDPYPTYAAWQAESPIWRDEGSGAWVLTRHDDVRAVLKNSADYSSDAMGGGGAQPLPLLTDDPPLHTKLRKLVDRAFTVRMLRSIEGWVTELSKRMVAELPVLEPVDIVQHLTIPLPIAVIARMMGIPGERADDFKRWSDALAGTLAGTSEEDRKADVMEMGAYFAGLIPERRANPGEDLVSAVVNAEIDGERLTDQQIIGFNTLLLIAGNETTTNLLGNFLNILANRPDLYQALRDDPSLIDAGVEEMLRYDAPVQFLMRRAIRSMSLHGQEITAGDTVFVVMAAANRDPRIYEHPDEFRLRRKKNHHHTFGFGIHFCIGAPLARLEARAAMRALLQRFPELRSAPGENERVPSPLLRGFHHLWLEFGP